METLSPNIAPRGIRMNHLWEKNRTAFQGNREADQWSDRNHWHKPDQFPRFELDVDKLIAQSIDYLSIFHCQSPRLLRLCTMSGTDGDNPVESWKSKIQWYSDNEYFSELNRIDGQPMEFEWKIFPGFTTVAILNEIQQMMGKLQCEPENFTGRINFMSNVQRHCTGCIRKCRIVCK